jgi:thiamine-phosphate pyrophosphorylase
MAPLESSAYRIIDANLNRAREGLRVAEEIARFDLEDSSLASHLKSLRHEITTILKEVPTGALLAARGSICDIGKNVDYDKKIGKQALSEILKASMSRAQEAMRVLEEFSGLADFPEGKKFKELRFRLYAIEKDLTEKLNSNVRRRILKDWMLYLILDEELIGNKDPLEIAAAAAMGGVNAIQWRCKGATDRSAFLLVSRLRQFAPLSSVAVIVNDRVDVAAMAGADGVHLGQDDIPLNEARKLLGEKKIIGISTHNQKEALEAEKEGADYVTVGPIFSTSTKKDAGTPLGLSKIAELKRVLKVPLVAIGGINETNIKEVVSAGADIVAVATAIIKAGDITEATKNLISAGFSDDASN